MGVVGDGQKRIPCLGARSVYPSCRPRIRPGWDSWPPLLLSLPRAEKKDTVLSQKHAVPINYHSEGQCRQCSDGNRKPSHMYIREDCFSACLETTWKSSRPCGSITFFFVLFSTTHLRNYCAVYTFRVGLPRFLLAQHTPSFFPLCSFLCLDQPTPSQSCLHTPTPCFFPADPHCQNELLGSPLVLNRLQPPTTFHDFFFFTFTCGPGPLSIPSFFPLCTPSLSGSPASTVIFFVVLGSATCFPPLSHLGTPQIRITPSASLTDSDTATQNNLGLEPPRPTFPSFT